MSAAPDDPELVELASAISSGVPIEWQDVLEKMGADGGAGVVVKSPGQEANNPVLGGAEADYPAANNHFIDQGRFFTDSEVEHHAI